MTNTTGTLAPLPSSMEERAVWLADAGGLNTAIDAGRLGEPVALPLAEALVLGLMRQGVTKYLAIFGHGSTAIGEVLRVYEDAAWSGAGSSATRSRWRTPPLHSAGCTASRARW